MSRDHHNIIITASHYSHYSYPDTSHQTDQSEQSINTIDQSEQSNAPIIAIRAQPTRTKQESGIPETFYF